MLPLNAGGPGEYLLHTLAHPNAPPLQRSLGVLDAQGRAEAAFSLHESAFVPLAGTTLQHAFLVLDPELGAAAVSHAVALAIVR